MRHSFQFQLDGRAPMGLVRGTWERAAQDAVNAGYARWIGPKCIESFGGARIKRLNVRPLPIDNR